MSNIIINIHQLASIANILNRMKNRIKAYKYQLPEGYANADILDINEIQEIFNSDYKEQIDREIKIES